MNSCKFKAKVVENGYSLRSLAKMLKISNNSMYRKANGHVEFRLKEVLSICELLNINDEEMCNIFLH